MMDIEPSTIKAMMLHSIKRLANNNVIEQYDSDADIKAEVARQWSAFQTNSGNFMPTSDEPVNSNTSYPSLRMYWTDRLQFTDTEMLATIALEMLAINPSEASVERSFSHQKLTHSTLRNRLADEVVEAQMFIKTNGPLLTSNDTKKDKSITHEWNGMDMEGDVETRQELNENWSKELDTRVE